MDHLPQPQNSITGYPIVQCLCAAETGPDESFRVQHLATFAFSSESFSESVIEPPSLSRAAPFLQAWLWFGTLERIFDIVDVHFDPGEFVVQEGANGLRLCTRALHEHYWYWTAAEAQVTADEKSQHCKLVNECLDGVYDALQCYVTTQGNSASQIEDCFIFGPFLNDNTSNILLAITLLAEALDYAQECIYNDFQVGQSRAWDDTLQIRESFLQAGWCINELAWLTDQFTVARASSLLFLSRIDRHVFSKDHSKCTLGSCEYEKIDYSTYRPKHALNGCVCHDVGLRYDQKKKMDSIICRNGIPLLTYEIRDSFGPQLYVHQRSKAKPEIPYVAISHVWSDRLGNLRENALPDCQLKKLQDKVNALYPLTQHTVPFWIDTICIPCEMTTRALAINKTRAVHEGAEKVLVLDASLQALDSSISQPELLIRIMTCTWSTRLWTYHEGALARRVYFQLQDCAVSGDGIEARYHSQYEQGVGSVSVADLVRVNMNIRYQRSLLRAMSLDEDGETFSSGQEEARKYLLGEESNSEVPNSQDEASSIESNQVDDESSDSPEAETYSNFEDNEALNKLTQESIARTQAMQAEIERLEAETAQIQAQSAQIRVKQHLEDDEIAHLEMTALGGSRHRQVPPTGLHIDIPMDVFTCPPRPADKELAANIKQITTNFGASRYWLRAFNPLFLEGQVSYMYLRTSYKRLSLHMRPGSVPKAMQIVEIIRAIRWRTTSWKRDEAVCFAIILGLDVAKVQAAPADDRMKVVVSLWEEVPSALLFCSPDTIDAKGFRWMPKSFLQTGLYSLGTRLKGKEEARRSENGLHLEAEGILFKLTETESIGDIVAIKLNDYYTLTIDRDSKEDTWDDLRDKDVAVLLSEPLRRCLYQSRIASVVTKVIEEVDGTTYVERVFDARINSVDQLDHIVLINDVRHVDSTHQWCID